jgi:hypothetical protein
MLVMGVLDVGNGVLLQSPRVRLLDVSRAERKWSGDESAKAKTSGLQDNPRSLAHFRGGPVMERVSRSILTQCCVFPLV